MQRACTSQLRDDHFFEASRERLTQVDAEDRLAVLRGLSF
jgi:hypothetical protein